MHSSGPLIYYTCLAASKLTCDLPASVSYPRGSMIDEDISISLNSYHAVLLRNSCTGTCRFLVLAHQRNGRGPGTVLPSAISHFSDISRLVSRYVPSESSHLIVISRVVILCPVPAAMPSFGTSSLAQGTARLLNVSTGPSASSHISMSYWSVINSGHSSEDSCKTLALFTLEDMSMMVPPTLEDMSNPNAMGILKTRDVHPHCNLET
jgi:hypothetical protein